MDTGATVKAPALNLARHRAPISSLLVWKKSKEYVEIAKKEKEILANIFGQLANIFCCLRVIAEQEKEGWTTAQFFAGRNFPDQKNTSLENS